MVSPLRQFRFFAALLFAIALTLSILWVSPHQKGIAAEPSIQLNQSGERSPTPREESVITRLFDLAGREIARFPGHYLNFSPDGLHLLTSSNDSEYRYSWFNVSGERLMHFDANGMSVSPDGQRLIIITGKQAPFVSAGDTIAIHDASGRKLNQLQAEAFLGLDITPDSQQIALMAKDRVYLLDAKSGQEAAQIQGESLFFGTIPFFGITNGFDPTGQFLALHQGESNSLHCELFDRSGQLIVQMTKSCLRFNADGQKIILLSNELVQSVNDAMQVYDIPTRKAVSLPIGFPRFSPDGQFILLNVDFQNNISYLYRSSGEKVAELQGKDGQFSPDSQRVLTVSGNTAHLYNLSGREIAQLSGTRATFLPEGSQPITFLESEDDNSSSSSADGETRLFDVSGKQLALLQGNPPDTEINRFWAGGEYPSPAEFALADYSFTSPDGQYFVTSDRRISYLYRNSGELIAAVPGRFHLFSSTGQHFITQSGDRFDLFDIAGKKLAEVDRDYPSYQPWFNPNGQNFVMTARNKP